MLNAVGEGMSHRLKVFWNGVETPASELGGQFEITTTFSDDIDAAVLGMKSFSSVKLLLQERAKLSGVPVLIVSDSGALHEIIPSVRSGFDDVCEDGAVPSLVALRLQRLVCEWRHSMDVLSKLPNRAAAFGHLERACARAESGEPLSVLMISIERGGKEENEIIRAFAKRLQSSLPDETFIARVGSNEFLAMLEMEAQEAMAAAAKLCGDVEAAERMSGAPSRANVGVSSYACKSRMEGPRRPEQLMDEANQALFGAKSLGKNRALHFENMVQEVFHSEVDAHIESLKSVVDVITAGSEGRISIWLERLTAELKKQAELDGLTGLYNRRYLDRKLARDLARSSMEVPMTVALLDVDHFGEFNRTHGYPTGDKVLRDVAQVLRAPLRGCDWVARYGGEEFCIVLYGMDCEKARPLLERIRTCIEVSSFASTQGRPLHITASVGAASWMPLRETPSQFMERVSDKLLEAKRTGRNRVCA